MRVTSRLIFSLVIGIAAVTFIFAGYEVQNEKRGLQADLRSRATVLGESLATTIEPLLDPRSSRELQRVVNRFGDRQGLAGVAVYGLQGGLRAAAPALARRLTSCPAPVIEAMAHDQAQGDFSTLDGERVYVYALPLHRDGAVVGALADFHDASYIAAESAQIWRDTLLRVLIQMVLVALITLLIVRWSIHGPLTRMTQWMRALRSGAPGLPAEVPEDFFKPIAHEVNELTRSLADARLAAESEARLREAGESLWTPERLRVHLRDKLPEGSLFVVSNREPYMHVHLEDSADVKVVVPASGLVTGLEPVLLACGGTWIAQGSGDADRENSDTNSRLRVPPKSPQYTLRRVWLTPEEEHGYYVGFANEGLWPLCHIAYTRPVFRASDWEYYRRANEKFAQAVIEEIEGTANPYVLIQDYHFALLPRLLKQARPDARVSLFWHIPWPNPQVFGICPWEKELLDGLLGADSVGFHTQSHCNYFLETVDSVLESRIEWEHSAVERLGHRTVVGPFPISVPLNDEAAESANPYRARAQLFSQLGVEGVFLGVGVDRVDYTKGILERFRGIERFFERFPRYRRQFTFVQIGAPSRTEIDRYAGFLVEVEAEAERINTRFQSGRWKPIVLLRRHHTHQEIAQYYRAADLCLVTSLHDGMNLVAKEFVAARSDAQGVLILSRFTGAARELTDALIVNPYDTEEVAKAILIALEMDSEERAARMRRLRQTVREHNIYRWAANLIGALTELRLDQSLPKKPQPAALERYDLAPGGKEFTPPDYRKM